MSVLKQWSKLTVFGLLAVFGLLSSSAVKADSVTFASFEEKTLGNEFKYDSTGVAGSGGNSYFLTNTTPLGTSAGSGGLTPTPIDVNFRYVASTIFTAGLNPLLLGNQDARLTLNVTSATGVIVFAGFAFQQNMLGSLEIRRTVPLLGKDLLLRVDFNGRYQGTNGGQTSSLQADATLGDSVTFTSDFVNFSGATGQNMANSFTSVTPLFIKDLISKFFTPHTAHGTGSFAANNAIVPEPGTIVGAFAGLLFAGLAAVRRRAKTA